MAFTDGFEIDDTVGLEIAESSFIVSLNPIFTAESVEIDDEIELAPSSFIVQTNPVFTRESLDIDDEIELGSYKNMGSSRVPIFNESAPAIDLLIYALQPEGRPGSTFSQGLEIVMEASENIFLSVEDILDILDYEGDIRLILDEGEGKLNIKQNDLERDAGLETAVLISLFTDQRATQDDLDKDGLNDLRGWWGDQFAETEGDQTGSFLWLLERAKIDQTALSRAQDYAKKALMWTIDDGVVKDISVTVTRHALEGILIQTEATRPKGDAKVTFKYFYNWKAQELRRVG